MSDVHAQPGQRRGSMWIVLACALYCVAGGAITLIGWFADLPRLTDWDGDGIAMFVNPAICALCSGVGLLLMHANVRLLTAAAGGVVAFLGLATLAQHITGVNLHIDTLLLQREWGQAASAAPMRMGPPASTSFAIIGVALLMLATGRPRLRFAAANLGLLVIVIATFSIFGYVYRVESFYALPRLTGIALQTATMLAAIGVGLVAVVNDRGMAALLADPGAGGVLVRRLILPIILIPALVGWVRVLGQDAGLYGTRFGTALFALVVILGLFALLVSTARELRRAERHQIDVQGRLAAIVRSSDDAIISKTLDGIITSWNEGAHRLFGYSAADAVGQPITMLFPRDRIAEEASIIDQIRRGRRIDSFETVRRRKDGALLDVSVSISPIHDAEGGVVGASKIARDITERKRGQQRVRDALREAERAAVVKDEFLATLSHELRTPMTAIVGWAQILDDASPEEVKEGLDVIRRNARLQTQIIEDLLDMSRIESGKVRLEVQSVNLGEVVGAAAEAIRPAASAKGVRFDVICGPHIAEIRGDPARLQQVVYNLLTNAIKFTPRDGRVQLTCQRVNSHVEVSVSDTGLGISPQFLPHVFERFRQQDASMARQHSGLGLGLAIVKHLVELHGGTIQAASAGEGQGATFTVHLPIAVAIKPQLPAGGIERAHPSASAMPEMASGREQKLAGLRILVVDDEADARELMRKVLLMHGAHPLVAGSGQEALDRLGRHRPDLLICDIGMPGMDGYTLIERVRSLEPEKGGATPAIALTAFARSQDRARSLLSGFQIHLSKPVDSLELVAAIMSLSSRRRFIGAAMGQELETS